MNKEILQKTIDYLKQLDPARFDMGTMFNTPKSECFYGAMLNANGLFSGTSLSDKFDFLDEHMGDVLVSTRAFLGDTTWASIDNTIEGAIRRAEHILNGGTAYNYLYDLPHVFHIYKDDDDDTRN